VLDLAVVFGVAVALAGWWYARNWLLYGDPTGLRAMLDVVGRRAEPLTARALLGQFAGLRISYWGLFGWFNLPLPGWAYRLFDLASLIALLGLFVRLGCRGRPAGDSPAQADRWWPILPAAWIALMLASLVRWTLTTPGTQGRLLFPAAWAINLLLAYGWCAWAAHLEALAARSLSALQAATVRRVWLAIPLIWLAGWAILAPLLVIRPAYTPPDLIDIDQVPPAARRAPVLFGTQARLLGGAIDPPAARPGDTIWVTLFWEVLSAFDQDYTVFIHLTDRDGRSVAEANSWPGLGAYPTRLWQPGTVIVDRYPLDLPGGTRAPMLLDVDVGLFIPATLAQLPSVDANGRPAATVIDTLRILPVVAAAARPQYQADARFGDSIRLIGFDRPLGERAVAPGSQVAIDLIWQTDKRIETDYAIFLHLRRPDGANVSGADGQPLAGAWPTSAWEPGDPVMDPRAVRVPADAPPGLYELWLGLYAAPDGARLTVTGAGLRVLDNALFVGAVVVKDD
jgi:hypothetical protein